MREYIRAKQYIMTIHAEEEMSDDNLTIFDVEHVILTGKIIERQKDNTSVEWKYLIEGNTISRHIATVVVKISITNKLVIITVFIGSPYDM
ncbi:MAG: DUF4258 domain-containing protein [Gammaproteobacteria bacterium]|nr:DUF4258 domain-containing protein [Gammaproteobacteria bacterium]